MPARDAPGERGMTEHAYPIHGRSACFTFAVPER
jgi:hypothetical protein